MDDYRGSVVDNYTLYYDRKSKTQPQFAGKCDKWNEFDVLDWRALLKKQPQFADKCDKWNEFDVLDWCELLKAQPQAVFRDILRLSRSKSPCG